MVLEQDPPDGGHGERDRMVSPEEEPEPRDPVLAVLPDPEDQRFDVRRGAKRTHPGSWQAGFQALESLALIPTEPFIEKSPRDSKEPTGTADIATDLFIVLQHAEAGGRTLGSLSIPNASPSPGPPFARPHQRAGSVRASP